MVERSGKGRKGERSESNVGGTNSGLMRWKKRVKRAMEKSGMVERNGIKDRKKGISLKYSRSGPHTLLRCRIGVCKALFLWQVHWGHGDLSCEAGWSHYWAIIVQKSVLQEHSISHGKILHGCSLVDWINLTCQFLQLGSLPVTGL